MAALDYARLKISAVIDGSTRNGVFEFAGNARVAERTRFNYKLQGFGEDITNAVKSAAGARPYRQATMLDLGTGRHIWEIDFEGWEGAVDQSGNALRWGDGSGNMPYDAQGKDPLQQIQVFNNYLRNTKVSSLNPVQLQIGEYSSNGSIQNEVDVTLREPRFVHSAEDYSTFDGSIICMEALTLGDVGSIIGRLGF